MSFDYTRDIPDGPHNPSNDQPNMKINTNSIDNLLAVDHVSFNSVDSGKHNFVHLTNQTPTPSVGATEGVIFQRVVGSNTELFYRYGSAPSNTFQITNNGASASAIGFTSLIGPAANPMNMKWGFQAGTSGNNYPIVFATAFISTCFCVFTNATATDGTGLSGLHVFNVSKTGFTCALKNGSLNTVNGFYWLAIGN